MYGNKPIVKHIAIQIGFCTRKVCNFWLIILFIDVTKADSKLKLASVMLGSVQGVVGDTLLISLHDVADEVCTVF